MKPETLLVHAGAEPDPATAAVAPPIHLSTTFRHGPAGELEHGHEYIRESNPTQDRLEAALAAIEQGAAALAFGSGMAAASAVFQSLRAGSHVLLPRDVYHGTRAYAREFLGERSVTHAAVDGCDCDAIEAAWRDSTALVWLETPSNPLLEIADIAAVASFAHARGAIVAVDSTFASPALQNPLALGADIVMHSTTKYLGGHSDVMGGALVFRERGAWHERAALVRGLQGAVMAPFNAWLTLRGLRTLSCRIERHCRNALAVATFLASQPAVARVRYPGLASHPQHALARRQMRDFGGMLSFELAGGREAALRVASRVALFTNATSLGGVESLIEHRASVEGAHATSPPGLLRVSVGLEHPDDLVADLAQALA
ncbi:MAG TPA: PLP-dependent aspartate aminotransferase family protein [Candidatus Saccharimonadia bacterium]|nr:PLP-dependent aspartate aminotransferase family protein [Candidatus Saccharimonadia bacterium]